MEVVYKMKELKFLVYYDAMLERYYWTAFKVTYGRLMEEINIRPVAVTESQELAQSMTHNCNLTLNS